MPSRKRSRTPPAAPAPAAAAPVPAPAPAPSLRETFERRHFLAAALVVLASVPALLSAVWDRPADLSLVVVPAVIALTVGAIIFDREQWILESRRRCCSRSASERWRL